jgi:DNA-binding LacI/PurR family transcriptional regulator
VGHDDLMMARYGAVPLTTVSHPVEAIAQAVVDTLLSRLTGDPASPPKQTTVKGRLVVRQSAAPFQH